jgi:hypothetical protein
LNTFHLTITVDSVEWTCSGPSINQAVKLATHDTQRAMDADGGSFGRFDADDAGIKRPLAAGVAALVDLIAGT